MTAVHIRSSTATAGAAATLARATELLLDGRTGYTDDLLPDGRLDSDVGPLAAHDVAVGGAAILAKLVADVEAVLVIDRAETLSKLGRWIATQDPNP